MSPHPTSFLRSACYVSLNYLVTFWVPYLGGFHMYKISFSFVNLSYANLIIRPAKEPYKVRMEHFSPQHDTSTVLNKSNF